jgi:CBS domain-containing protein
MTSGAPALKLSLMRVKEVMRPAWGLDMEASLDDVARAMEVTGCEALPIVDGSNGEVLVRQIVALRDLPKLRRIEASGHRGHAVGTSALDLLEALGRSPGRFPTIAPDATLTDAWGEMSEEGVPHLAVVEGSEIVGMVSLVVTFSEFPYRSPAAGFWP